MLREFCLFYGSSRLDSEFSRDPMWLPDNGRLKTEKEIILSFFSPTKHLHHIRQFTSKSYNDGRMFQFLSETWIYNIFFLLFQLTVYIREAIFLLPIINSSHHKKFELHFYCSNSRPSLWKIEEISCELESCDFFFSSLRDLINNFELHNKKQLIIYFFFFFKKISNFFLCENNFT